MCLSLTSENILHHPPRQQGLRARLCVCAAGGPHSPGFGRAESSWISRTVLHHAPAFHGRDPAVRAAPCRSPRQRRPLSGTRPGAQCREAPRRRQAEPIGASGQLPPRPQASLLLLLKDPPERVYVEPCKLPARDFAISQEIRTCACKRGLGAAGPTKRISELRVGGGGSKETLLF